MKMIKLGLQRMLLLCMIITAAERMSSIKADYQQEELLTMSVGEQDALYAVMDAMAGGVDWRVLHPHPCTDDLWPGLVCEQGLDDGFLHVTRLDFGYKPNPACAPNASIPTAITKLSRLRSLFIFECFSTMNTTIPLSLVKLAPTLQELSLRTNSALVGSIPAELSSLTSLQLLSLSQNGLTGHIPAQLSKLKALQHLDLSDNSLSGELPPELGSLHNLVILDLSVNSLSGPVPSSWGNLTMLQKLDLSFNSLQGVLPQELGNMRKLQFLAMNDNMITGPCPAQMASLGSLQYLILDNNPMNTTLPSFIGGYRNLMALSLSNSGYFGTIPEEYSKLENLTVLSLDRNNLTGSIPSGLGQLPHIYQLNLSLNSLSGAIPFTPEFVKKLGRNLDLNGNTALCSHWALPQVMSKPGGGGLALCSTEPKYSKFSTSPASKRRITSLSASSFCILYTVILLHL
eukprot:c36999_g1_i1 orf=183-1556(+)